MGKCNCIEEKTDQVKKYLIEGKNFKKEIVGVQMENVAMTFGKAGSRTFSKVLIELSGQKKKEEIRIFNSYCPFCGTKAES